MRGVLMSVASALFGGMAEPIDAETKLTIFESEGGRTVWSRADSELPLYVHVGGVRDEIGDDLESLSVEQFQRKWLTDCPSSLPKASKFASPSEN